MKAYFPVLASAIAALGLGTAEQTRADLHLANVVGHWKFDSEEGSTAVDSVHGNNGTWQNENPASLSWTTGFIGGAASLNDLGGNDFFRIEALPQLENGAGWTISAWIEPAAQTGGYNGIFMSRTTNGGGSWGMALEGSGPFHTDNRMPGIALDSPDTILIEGLTATDSWYHVANTWDAGTGIGHAYINGALVASSANGSAGAITSSGVWFIGYDDCCGGNRDFTGLIDDIAMWNLPLADADIAEIYTNGLAGKDALGNAPPFLRPVDGDVDGNRIVDDTDFEIIRTSFFQTVTSRDQGDLNGDGFVDFVDFNRWKVASPGAAASSTGVPEPVSVALVLGTALGGLVVRCRRGAG